MARILPMPPTPMRYFRTQLECIEKSEKMSVEYSGGKTVITVDLKAANGRKFEMRFHK